MESKNPWGDNEFMKTQAQQFARAQNNPRLASTLAAVERHRKAQEEGTQYDDGVQESQDYYFSKEKGDQNKVAELLDDDRVLINPLGREPKTTAPSEQ